MSDEASFKEKALAKAWGRSDPEDIGKLIIVKINGVEIQTHMDDDGVQRLPSDPVLHRMLDHCQETGMDLCRLWRDAEYKEAAMRLLYQNIGYSVCGYLDVFDSDEIENPLWDDALPAEES